MNMCYDVEDIALTNTARGQGSEERYRFFIVNLPLQILLHFVLKRFQGGRRDDFKLHIAGKMSRDLIEFICVANIKRELHR